MNHSFTLLISGEAGQGIQTIESFLLEALAKDYHVSSHQDVMSRVRGGNNTTEIRLTSQPLSAYQDKINLLFLLNDHALDRLKGRLDEDSLIIGEEDSLADPFLKDHKRKSSLALKELAKEAGGAIYANTVLVGYVVGLLGLDLEGVQDKIRQVFSHKKASITEDNLKALDLGLSKAQTFLSSGLSLLGLDQVDKKTSKAPYKIMNGSEAMGLGALAGGVQYMSSYPMSPSTGLLIYLADKGPDFGVLVEQAEDEIAALNMALGAAYAGARAMVTTSGGGIALMSEAISLAGMTETPCVIHDAMRPGPATGLPTRTEQGDLDLVLYAGHGDFPRIILAPADLKDGIVLSQQAFRLADKYQLPVFILSDQFYTDSQADLEVFNLEADPENESQADFIQTTSPDYERYAPSENGVSPRGIPGLGQGLVKVDSDEHDSAGQITEDFKVRVHMQDKRMRKKKACLEDYQAPHQQGNPEAGQVIIGWGSTYGPISSYVQDHEDSLFYIHLRQLYPLDPALKTALKDKTLICVENNSTGQLADLLTKELGLIVDHRLLKYSGQPFSTEEISAQLEELVYE